MRLLRTIGLVVLLVSLIAACNLATTSRIEVLETSTQAVITATTVASTNTPIPVNTATPEPRDTLSPYLGIHVVRSGETVGCIARAYGVSTQSIQEENNVSNLIHPGDELKIPRAGLIDTPSSSNCVAQFTADESDNGDIQIVMTNTSQPIVNTPDLRTAVVEPPTDTPLPQPITVTPASTQITPISPTDDNSGSLIPVTVELPTDTPLPQPITVTPARIVPTDDTSPTTGRGILVPVTIIVPSDTPLAMPITATPPVSSRTDGLTIMTLPPMAVTLSIRPGLAPIVTRSP